MIIPEEIPFNSSLFYLTPNALKSFPDVILTSKERAKFSVNRNVLASHSSMIREAISFLNTIDDDLSVITDIPTGHLEKVMEYLFTGSYPRDNDDGLRESFFALGMILPHFPEKTEDDRNEVKTETSESEITGLKMDVVDEKPRPKRRRRKHKVEESDDEENADYDFSDSESKMRKVSDDEEGEEDEDDDLENEDDDEIVAEEKDSKAKAKRRNWKAATKPRRRVKDRSKFVKCPHCEKEMPNNEYYKQHVVRHSAPSKNDVYYCFKCKIWFPTIATYSAHRKTHRQEVQCPHCPHTIKMYHLKKHIQTHIDPSLVTCINCGKVHNNESLLKHHYQIYPLHQPVCNYEDCDFKFSSFIEHTKHVEKEHDGKMIYLCGKCGERFNHVALHRQHIQSGHPTEKTVCPFCAKSLAQSNIKQHIERVHSVDPVKCETCDQMFDNKQKLQRHMMDHSVFPCEICGEIFKRQYRREQHMYQHKPESERPYQCKICNKGFTKQRRFTDHMNAHNGIKPHTCKYCNAAFVDFSNKNNHEKSVHLGIKRVYNRTR